MWVTTGEGQLVNLGQVQWVGSDGKGVFAVFDARRSQLLMATDPVMAKQYLDRMGIALGAGSHHLDLRHL
jgi:hypothetical protein